jgi:hypothetical protein
VTPGNCADLVVVDLDRPGLRPLTNVRSLITNAITGPDVETVLIDGEVVSEDDTVQTVNEEAVVQRATAAVERYQEETGWEIGLTDSDRPDTLSNLRDLPKRGAAHLVGRLAYQTIADRFPL